MPPLLGSSQTLLNRDHWAVYYEVSIAEHALAEMRSSRSLNKPWSQQHTTAAPSKVADYMHSEANIAPLQGVVLSLDGENRTGASLR